MATSTPSGTAVSPPAPASMLEASKREESGTQEWQKELTSEELKERVAKFQKNMAAGIDEILIEFTKCGGKGMIISMMVMLFNQT